MKRTTMIAAAAGVTAALALAGAGIGFAAAGSSSTPSGSSGPPGSSLVADATDTATPDNFLTDSHFPETSLDASPPAVADGQITAGRASDIALGWAGGGRVTEIEAEREHGRPVWDVELVKDGVEHEVSIDRNTGAILKAERDDDDDRGRSGKGSDDD